MARKAARASGPTVLVVDDNHHMRVLLIEILRALDIRDVYEAGDGTEALKLMRTRMVDLVITDLAMAPMDGLDFVRILRTAPDSPNQIIPVIMISGHSTQRRVEEARDVGVNEFLAKPVTARGIVDRINEVIEHPRAFVRSEDFVGPDRRRKEDAGYAGPKRRATDAAGDE